MAKGLNPDIPFPHYEYVPALLAHLQENNLPISMIFLEFYSPLCLQVSF